MDLVVERRLVDELAQNWVGHVGLAGFYLVFLQVVVQLRVQIQVCVELRLLQIALRSRVLRVDQGLALRVGTYFFGKQLLLYLVGVGLQVGAVAKMRVGAALTVHLSGVVNRLLLEHGLVQQGLRDAARPALLFVLVQSRVHAPLLTRSQRHAVLLVLSESPIIL